MQVQTDFALIEKTRVADNIFDNFYGYNMSKVDGKKLLQANVNTYRDNDNYIELGTKNTTDGIYAVKI